MKKPFLLFVFVIGVIAGCGGESIMLSANDEGAIQTYLDEKVMLPAFGGKVYSAHKVLGTESDRIFIWALMQEYYEKDGKLEKGRGWSVPLVLIVEKKGESLVIISHQSPGDGSRYSEDIEKMFPVGLQNLIIEFPGTQAMRELELESGKRSVNN